MKNILILFIVLVPLDFLVVKYIYNLLFGFLIGATNKKSATKIHEEESIRNQITLQYIECRLKKRKKEFGIIRRIYSLKLWLLLPQYIALAVLCLVSLNVAPIAMQILCVIKIIEFLIVRLQFDGNRVPYSAAK